MKSKRGANPPKAGNLAEKKILVGVTGGIGSGKSLVCKFLEELGCRVFYADNIAKKLYSTNINLARSLSREFGNHILSGNRISIPRLRRFIFKNPNNQRVVNSIVHPFVISEILSKVSRSTKKLIAIEAALIFESGFDKYLDCTVLVHSTVKKRIERTIRRNSFSKEQVRKIMKMQMPEKEKLRRADFVIENNGTIGSLKQKTKELFNSLKQRLEKI